MGSKRTQGIKEIEEAEGEAEAGEIKETKEAEANGEAEGRSQRERGGSKRREGYLIIIESLIVLWINIYIFYG